MLQEYFLRTLTPIIASLPPRPSQDKVVAAVNALVELFRRVSQPATKTIQGLWAELFVILLARDPATLLRCWHTEPENRFDFASDTQRIDVKAASGRVRVHHFSFEQLHPPVGTFSMIASVLIERSAGGQNINDLVDRIREAVDDPELLLLLDATIAQILGSDWRAAQEHRFDHQLAEESLRFLDARSIPSVPTQIPPEVTDIHFRVDLTTHSLTLSDELRRADGLFAAAVR